MPPSTDSLYLYGFIQVPGAAAGLRSAESHDLSVLACGDVGCVVSPVSSADYVRPDAKSAADQLAWVSPRAAHHHDVLNRLHADIGVVPLKFGTLCGDADHVRNLVARLREPIRALLAQLRGRDEWTMHCFANPEVIAARLLDSNEELRALLDEEQRAARGLAYFLRKQRQKRIAEAVFVSLGVLESAFTTALTETGAEIASIERPEISVIETRACVAKCALLIERSRFAEVETRLADIEAAHAAEGVAFELVGPWPPYTFASTLDVAETRLQ